MPLGLFRLLAAAVQRRALALAAALVVIAVRRPMRARLSLIRKLTDQRERLERRLTMKLP